MATIKYKDPATNQWVEIPTGGTDITVDSALSSTSENPVQNKVINSALNGKQASLSAAQLNACNSGITSAKVTTYDGYQAKIDAKYTKPTGGIPKTDLASAVQTSLGKADTALQSVPSNYVTNTTYSAKTRYGVAKIWFDTTDNYLYIRTDGY